MSERYENAFENGTSLGSGETISRNLEAQAGESITGKVKRASTSYNVNIEWLDDSGNVLFTESVASAVSGGDTTTFSVTARSPHANFKVSDDGSSSGEVTLCLIFR